MLSRPRRTAHEREQRDIRILAATRSGFSLTSIARTEALSHERVRQIVARRLEDERKGTRIELPTLQMARLESALRVAARSVDEGDLNAIVPLLKVLAQLDKYNAAANMRSSEGEDIRKRLMEKMDRVAARMRASAETDALKAKALESTIRDREEPESEPDDLQPSEI